MTVKIRVYDLEIYKFGEFSRVWTFCSWLGPPAPQLNPYDKLLII